MIAAHFALLPLTWSAGRVARSAQALAANAEGADLLLSRRGTGRCRVLGGGDGIRLSEHGAELVDDGLGGCAVLDGREDLGVAVDVEHALGLGRLHVGVHLPLDLVGGWCLGVLCGAAGLAVVARLGTATGTDGTTGTEGPDDPDGTDR